MNRLTNCRIALADDDADDQFLFEQALRQVNKDAVLTTFDDGVDLMRSLLHNKAGLPDIVFLDVNMPKKNGIRCLEEIREHEALKELPVVILTTSVRQEDIKKVYDEKSCLFFHKPDNLSNLIAIIQNVLSMNLSHRDPVSS